MKVYVVTHISLYGDDMDTSVNSYSTYEKAVDDIRGNFEADVRMMSSNCENLRKDVNHDIDENITSYCLYEEGFFAQNSISCELSVQEVK